MQGKYFWLSDCDAQNECLFHQHPGQENLGNYPSSKKITSTIHKHVCIYILRTHGQLTNNAYSSSDAQFTARV